MVWVYNPLCGQISLALATALVLLLYLELCSSSQRKAPLLCTHPPSLSPSPQLYWFQFWLQGLFAMGAAINVGVPVYLILRLWHHSPSLGHMRLGLLSGERTAQSPNRHSIPRKAILFIKYNNIQTLKGIQAFCATWGHEADCQGTPFRNLSARTFFMRERINLVYLSLKNNNTIKNNI